MLSQATSEEQAWVLVYGISLAIGMLGRKGAAPGFEERFADKIDSQARAVADQAVTTLKEKGVL